MQGSGIVSLICKVEGQASKVWTWSCGVLNQRLRFSESEEVVMVFKTHVEFKDRHERSARRARRARSHTICQSSTGQRCAASREPWQQSFGCRASEIWELGRREKSEDGTVGAPKS